jgi:tetratricopeptide (TPR) repeat protein
LINSLSKLPNLRVTARSAVIRYRGTWTDPSKIGRELGVQAVLIWSLRKHGDRLHVQTELVKVADGSRLWGAQYDRPIAEVLDLQQRFAQAVAQQLTSEPKRADAEVVRKRPTISPEAFELYSRARFLLNRRTGSQTPDTAAREMAREYYEQALAKDPNFALAWSGLAEYYSYKGNCGKAEPLVRRALAIDSTSGDAWGDLGILLTSCRHDDDGAGRAFERGVALGPTNPDAHWYYGEWLLMRRRFDESIAEMQKAVDLDPVDYSSNFKLGWALLVSRRYDGAIAQLERAQELAPNDFATIGVLAYAYERKGMYPEAAAALEKSLLFNGDTVQAAKLARAFAARGVRGYWEVRRAALLEELAGLEQRARGGDVDTTGLIWVHAQLGNREPAFALLSQVPPMELRGILWSWLMDSLRSDPRFGELVRKAGLPLIEGER